MHRRFAPEVFDLNRDKNSCLNIKKIVNYWLQNNVRPLRYRRDYDLPKQSGVLSLPKIIIRKLGRSATYDAKHLKKSLQPGVPNVNKA